MKVTVHLRDGCVVTGDLDTAVAVHLVADADRAANFAYVLDGREANAADVTRIEIDY